LKKMFSSSTIRKTLSSYRTLFLSSPSSYV
jgi:hypothetical protein